MSKKERLIQAIKDFETDEKSREDLFSALFTVVVSVTRQGSGLDWGCVKKCIVESNIDYKPIEEVTIPFTYASLRLKLDWSDFCDLTGVGYYSKNEGYEIKDSEIFHIKESGARVYGLIK